MIQENNTEITSGQYLNSLQAEAKSGSQNKRIHPIIKRYEVKATQETLSKQLKIRDDSKRFKFENREREKREINPSRAARRLSKVIKLSKIGQEFEIHFQRKKEKTDTPSNASNR